MFLYKILFIFSVLLFVFGCHSKNEKLISQTKLQRAVFSGTINDIKNCLKEGASLNKPIGCGDFLPLEGAMVINDIEKFKFMLQNGARPNKRCITFAKKQIDQTYLKLLESKKVLKKYN